MDSLAAAVPSLAAAFTVVALAAAVSMAAALAVAASTVVEVSTVVAAGVGGKARADAVHTGVNYHVSLMKGRKEGPSVLFSLELFGQAQGLLLITGGSSRALELPVDGPTTIATPRHEYFCFDTPKSIVDLVNQQSAPLNATIFV